MRLIFLCRVQNSTSHKSLNHSHLTTYMESISMSNLKLTLIFFMNNNKFNLATYQSRIVPSLFTFKVVLTFFKWNFFILVLTNGGLHKRRPTHIPAPLIVNFKVLLTIKEQYSTRIIFQSRTMNKLQTKDHFLIKVTDQNAFQIFNFHQQMIMFSVYIFLTCRENKHNDMFTYKYKPKSRFSYHSFGFSDWPVLFISPFKR